MPALSAHCIARLNATFELHERVNADAVKAAEQKNKPQRPLFTSLWEETKRALEVHIKADCLSDYLSIPLYQAIPGATWKDLQVRVTERPCLGPAPHAALLPVSLTPEAELLPSD